MAIVLSHWRQQWGEVAKLLQSKKVTACSHQKDRVVNYHYFSGMYFFYLWGDYYNMLLDYSAVITINHLFFTSKE